MSVMSEIYGELQQYDFESINRKQLSKQCISYLDGLHDDFYDEYCDEMYANENLNEVSESHAEVMEQIGNLDDYVTIYDPERDSKDVSRCVEKPDTDIAETRAEQNMKKRIKRSKAHRNTQIMQFIRDISATEDFHGGCKMIETPKGENGCYGFSRLAFFRQDNDEDMEFWVNSIAFRQNHLYYITKNSYKANYRTTDNLFSLDNIVIDIDNHKDTPDIVDHEVERLLYLLDNDYQYKLPSYGIVRTGRGLQLWIGLQSVYASAGMRYYYEQLSKEFCNILDSIIKENGISLDVDFTASTRCNGLVKLPDTYNIKRKGLPYRIISERFPLERYSIKELFEEYTSRTMSDKKKSDTPKTTAPKRFYCHVAKKPSGENDYTAYALKWVKYLEQLVNARRGDCIGQRELILFHYHNFAVQLFDEQTAEQMTITLNQQFTEPLRESEAKHPATAKKLYKYSIQRIFADLELSEDEQRMYYECTNSRVQKRADAKQKKAERNESILALHEKGLSKKEIAEAVNCCLNTVIRVLSETISTCTKEERNEQILQLRKEGLSQQEIADKIGCNRKTVANVLKSSSVQIDKAEMKSEERPHNLKAVLICLFAELTKKNEEPLKKTITIPASAVSPTYPESSIRNLITSRLHRNRTLPEIREPCTAIRSP